MTPSQPQGLDDPRYIAAIEMIGRTGAISYQIRYSDDEQPVVWMAVASYRDGKWEVAAAADPIAATLRLCERVVDGGICAQCKRMTAFDVDFGAMPLADVVCWYQFDPERVTFRRGCEGDQ